VLNRVVAFLLSLPIRAYQLTLSPLLGRSCRFFPSCSTYALLCLEKYDVFPAVLKILKRLGSCHPFHPGGYDPP
jgi:uncharacterized protein